MLVVQMVSYILPFVHQKIAPSGSNMSSLSTNALSRSLFLFFISQKIGMCYLAMLWLASSKIQEFPP